MRRARRAATLLVLAVAGAGAACSAPAVFPCQRNEECRVGATEGRCEPAGYCSLPDDSCESGYRFVEQSPGSIAGECVEEGGGGCDVDPDAPGCQGEGGCAVAIASGAAHSCAIDQAGDVWCWGEDGELRLGSTGGATAEPRKVTGLDGAADLVAAGGSHSCAVVDGQVYCWGANDAGQLGLGAAGAAALAGEAVGDDLTGVHALAAGDRHVCVSDFDDTVYCWGANGDDQVQDGEPAEVTSAYEVSGILQCAIGVAAGTRHSAAVFEDGVVRTWGEADAPALGRGDVATPGYAEIVVDAFEAVAVTAGSEHTCGLAAGDGAIYCWGESDDGRLGLTGGGGDESAPVELTAQGSADEVSAGGAHTCARAGGALRCWGANGEGQLGSEGGGGSEARMVPGAWSAVAAGGNHTCAIAVTGEIYCWGGGDAGAGGSSQARRVALPCE